MNSIMIISKTNVAKNQQFLFIRIRIDSLMYETEMKNVYENFINNKERFDFSNFSNESK